MPKPECWIQTFTGNIFHPLDPRPDEVHIEDIAHALSLLCRWQGHCQTFYSVAQHSVLVSGALPAKYQLWGLLHDAAEAYLNDIASPIKRHMPVFVEIENKVLRAVAEKFSLIWPMPPEIKREDEEILLAERRDLIAECHVPRAASGFTAAEGPITPWTPEHAERMFLILFRLLTDPGK